MSKVIVGIVPTSKLFLTDDPFQDSYSFVNNYAKKIYECGGIPVGLLLNNGEINYEALDMCDAFIIPGGSRVTKDIYLTINYAMKFNKPLLGICMGAEAIDIFSVIYDYMDNTKELNFDDFIKKYKVLKDDNEGTLLRRLDSPNMHGDVEVTRLTIDKARHDIKINKDSLLYSIYKQEHLNVVSLHNYDFKHVGKSFKISAIASDGVNEAIEDRDKNHFILGVHFHPELEDNSLIFERLIKEAKERK